MPVNSVEFQSSKLLFGAKTGPREESGLASKTGGLIDRPTPGNFERIGGARGADGPME